MERYNKIKPIGSGTFGQAWLVESAVSQRKYALKELGVTTMSEQDRHLALNEAKILSRLKHKNIVRYKEAFVGQGKLCIAMEFAERGDLYTRIRERNGLHFPEMQILEWFTQLCLALKYIHGQNILHRDLKTQNIFLGKDDVIKLGDFGIARMLDSTLDHAQTTVGTPYYLSPEICQRKPYNHKSDMWSLGCVLHEMATLKHAFNANNFSALVIKILQGQYPPVPRCYGPLLEDLVSVLLQKNPDDRPSAKQLLYVPAMQPYVKRFLLSERDRTDSVASDIYDISSRSGPDCSQMSTRTEKANGDMKTTTSATDNSTDLKRDDQAKQNENVFVDAARERRLSSNSASKPRTSDNRPKEKKVLPAFDNVPKAREIFPASDNLLRVRENLRARCSVRTRKQSLLAQAHAQQRRHSEQNPSYGQRGSRIQKGRVHSQGAQFRETAETEDDVFAMNQATVVPSRSRNTINATNRQEANRHVVDAVSCSSDKLTSMAEQRRQKPELSVCHPKYNEDIRTRKRHQSAVTVRDRNCWPIENKHRRLTSRQENNGKDKENRGSLSAHAQVTAKRRVCSQALRQIQASIVEKQQTVGTFSGPTGDECEKRKRTYTISNEWRLSEFEIPEVDGRKHCIGGDGNCIDPSVSGSCKEEIVSCKDTNGRESGNVSQNEKSGLASESSKNEHYFNPQNGKRVNSSEQKCENIPQFNPKDTASETVITASALKPCCKFTFCGKTLHLDNVNSHDSVYAHMEALRMHLEKKLGTRLLTAVYRYVTNVSLEEHERIKQTVMYMLGEDNMTYFPVLRQLIACEAVYFH